MYGNANTKILNTNRQTYYLLFVINTGKMTFNNIKLKKEYVENTSEESM